MIRVLLVDDSPLQLELLTHILSADPKIEIIATAEDGEDAILKVKKYKPDVVTMDIHMPKLNGIEATKKIMATCPVPIIIICGCSSSPEIADTFNAIEAGAVSVTKKINFGQDDPALFIEMVKLMSEIKVVRRLEHLQIKRQDKKTSNSLTKIASKTVEVIAIGASTGGPLVLKTLFENLSNHFPPILVVQHIASGFIEGISRMALRKHQKKY